MEHIDTGSQMGFVVRDSTNPKLNIDINSKFVQSVGGLMQNKSVAINEKIAREGNLNVIIGKGEKTKFKIVKVEIN
jgi:hypothetical protein